MLGDLFPSMFGKENLHHHHCGSVVPVFCQVTPTVLPVPRPSANEVILCYLSLCSYHVVCPVITLQVNKTSGANPFKWLRNVLCSLLFPYPHNFTVSCTQSSELYCALSLKLP